MLLAALPNVRHGFFTRAGGVSQGLYGSLNCGPGSGDAPEAVAERCGIPAATIRRIAAEERGLKFTDIPTGQVDGGDDRHFEAQAVVLPPTVLGMGDREVRLADPVDHDPHRERVLALLAGTIGQDVERPVRVAAVQRHRLRDLRGRPAFTVTCADDSPTAIDDDLTVVEDSSNNFLDVLANDSDVDDVLAVATFEANSVTRMTSAVSRVPNGRRLRKPTPVIGSNANWPHKSPAPQPSSRIG